MYSQKGLSLDQAPPIEIVYRFFGAGAAFGIGGGLLLFIYQNAIFTPDSPQAVTFIHILTLGVMLSFMLGALFQMLPVLAGIKLASPVKKANLVQIPLTIGIISLLLAFNFHHNLFYWSAALLLGFSLLYIILSMLRELSTIKSHSATSKGIVIALIFLLLLVISALYLIVILEGYTEGKYFENIKMIHYSFGLYGWIALLIISISFQVIEMFYVTPPYPKIMSSYLPSVVFMLLILAAIYSFSFPSVWQPFQFLLAFVLSLYGLKTLKRLTQRKRQISDATVWFWRMGIGSLILSMGGMMLDMFVFSPLLSLVSKIFYASFALSIVFGMVYKIIPFLTWFHLNAQGYFNAPMMHEIIHPNTAKKHFWIHTMTITTFILSLIQPKFILAAAFFMILSFGWAGYQMMYAYMLYKKTQSKGERFTMS